MTDEKKPPRRPLGERSDTERTRPFGSGRPFGERDDSRQPFGSRSQPPAKPPISPTDPYQPKPPSSPPPPHPEPEKSKEANWWNDLLEEEEIPFAEEREEAARLDLKGTGILPPEYSADSLRAASYAPDEETAPAAERRIVIRFGVLLRSLLTIFGISAVVATLFTWWTPDAFLPRESISQLSIALATQDSPAQSVPTIIPPAPTATPLVNNIGIVSGHRGINPTTGLPDPGAVCADGVTEQEINEAVAVRVKAFLEGYGYRVDLLDEFDERLNHYNALAMVSIHSDSCQYINDIATGYKVASFVESESPEEDKRLVGCLNREYATTTGLEFHPSVTDDMTIYHSFREIAPNTPGAIIEIGFMYLDRELIYGKPDIVALGIVRGILCYLNEEEPTVTPTSQLLNTPEPTGTPTPTEETP